MCWTDGSDEVVTPTPVLPEESSQTVRGPNPSGHIGYRGQRVSIGVSMDFWRTGLKYGVRVLFIIAMDVTRSKTQSRIPVSSLGQGWESSRLSLTSPYLIRLLTSRPNLTMVVCLPSVAINSGPEVWNPCVSTPGLPDDLSP